MVEQARRIVQTFTQAPGDVRRARRLVGTYLDAWGLGARRAVLELVVSELVANAIRHGRGPVELQLIANGPTVRMEVCDRGGGIPRLRPVERTGRRAGGWGLRMVDKLVDAWGTEIRNGRTCIWIEHTYRRLFGNHRNGNPPAAWPD